MAFDPVWEEVFKTHAWGKYPGEDLIRFVGRNFYRAPDRAAVKVLEVGCGPGANLWYLAREGFTVHGIDGSSTAISQAKARLDAECAGWKGELSVGDIGNLPYDDESFDAVIDNEAIYANDFENSRKMYEELARVCKRGGKLFSRTFAAGCWGDETGQRVGHRAWLVAEGPMVGKGFTRFTAFEEIATLTKGFELEEVELLTRTMGSRAHEVREWLILGKKI